VTLEFCIVRRQKFCSLPPECFSQRLISQASDKIRYRIEVLLTMLKLYFAPVSLKKLSTNCLQNFVFRVYIIATGIFQRPFSGEKNSVASDRSFSKLLLKKPKEYRTLCIR
jgi:hypothetical protein